MLWINFLHLYQPANSDGYVIKEAVEKSYLRIIRALEKNPEAKFTLNINGCLLMRLEEMNYADMFERIGRLIRNGQIELTGNAAYHPILPLINPEEVKSQIRETENYIKKIFGDTAGNDYRPTGFFMSEMAYGANVAKIIKEMGYEWIILDEISLDDAGGKKDGAGVYADKASGLKIIARDRQASESYPPDLIFKLLRGNKAPETMITATDGELYGLRHEDPTAEFEKVLKEKKILTQLASEYIGSCDAIPADFRPSSWESIEKELQEGQPYKLWNDKNNIIQQELWKLAESAYETVMSFKDDPNFSWARWHLVRGLASCSFWWASGRDFKLFSPISWNPDEIERGMNEMIRAIRALDSDDTREIKMKAEKQYVKVKQLVWEQHWTYYWKRKDTN